MVWCSYCAKDQETESDDINGFTCCTGCGRVLDDNVYSSDPTFTKSADGQSQVQGNFVKDRHYGNFGRLGLPGSHGIGFSTDSHEKTLEKGRNEIKDIADFLAMSGRDDAVGAAHRLYTLALERNFTRGRRTNQVAAACLYIVCRQDQKPFLLIDFCDCLQTNVYVLGAIFLQLCRLLRLEQHHIMQKPVDPSLFIHRFTDRLVGRKTGHGKKFHSIANTALRLVASMKRDWMQTGRRPSGICGAALFISAHIHGFDCTKVDVVSVVHICEATLKKRLIEFENTESGSLTPEEFETRAKELEMEAQMIEAPTTGSKLENGKAFQEVLCEHKDLGAIHFAVGLCRNCYEEFVRISGGIQGGAAPPAFQRSEQKRMDEMKKKLRQQGLLSDEEDEEKQAEDSTGKSGCTDMVSKEPRRCKGRGRGRRKQASEIIGEQDIESMEEVGRAKSRGRGRGRRSGRGRGRGRKKFPEDGDGEKDLEASMLEEEETYSEDSALRRSKESGVAAQELTWARKEVGQLPESTANNGNAICDDQLQDHQLCEGMPGQHDSSNSSITEPGKGNHDDSFGVHPVVETIRSHDSNDDGDDFHDIDDTEVEAYLHNEEEVRLKTIIWTEMNKDYLEEQQAKEEALAASQAAQAAALAAAGSDSANALELAAAAAAAVAELKKDRKRRRAEAKNKAPAESAAEATRQMLESKKLSSKVNYGALEKLFSKDGIELTDDIKEAEIRKENHGELADYPTTDFQKLQGLEQSQLTVEKAAARAENLEISKGGVDEEDEDFMDEHEEVDAEDEQLPSYRLPYEQDDVYDDYYEY